MLVVGYGNPLRGDDGVGQEVALMLEAELADTGASTVLAHQLLPELALDASRSRLVIFIDAAAGESAGSLSVRPLSAGGWPRADPPADLSASAARAGSAAGAFSHQLGAADVLALARRLYGGYPVALLVSIGAASLEPGAGLSAAVRCAIPHAARAVLAAIDAAPLMSRGPQPAPGPGGQRDRQLVRSALPNGPRA